MVVSIDLLAIEVGIDSAVMWVLILLHLNHIWGDKLRYNETLVCLLDCLSGNCIFIKYGRVVLQLLNLTLLHFC